MAKDESKAFGWFKKGAEAGDAQSQYHMGHMLLYGIGCERNLRAATSWLDKAIAQGNPDAAELRRIILNHATRVSTGPPGVD